MTSVDPLLDLRLFLLLFQYFRRSVKEQTPKRVKTQVWSNVVTIVLVEARNLVARDASDDVIRSDPYVKFKLGTEKYKSKVG